MERYICFKVFFFLSSLQLFLFVLYKIGGATGMIGDPSGKSNERPALTEQFVERNSQIISENIQRIFQNHENFIWNRNKNNKALMPVKYYLHICIFSLIIWNNPVLSIFLIIGSLTIMTGTKK